MSSSEKMQYRDLLLDCRNKIDMAVSGRRNGKINSTVLESLLALRLFCNNGQAVTGVPVDSDEALSYLEQLDQNTCSYCPGAIYLISDTPDTDGGIIISGCRHLVCRSCIPHHLSRQNKCPSCDSGSSQSDMPMPFFGDSNEHRLPNPRRSMSLTKQYPTKLLALLAEISQNSAQKWYLHIEACSITFVDSFPLTSAPMIASYFQVGKKLSFLSLSF
jgi:SWI/SNF-related matrix-associated actin-dependent regulator of chromatin subfamily A3